MDFIVSTLLFFVPESSASVLSNELLRVPVFGASLLVKDAELLRVPNLNDPDVVSAALLEAIDSGVLFRSVTERN